MEINQGISIAVLQQSSIQQTATLVRIEGKVDRIEEALQRYVTIEHLEKNYTRREVTDYVAAQIRSIFWAIGIVYIATITALINSIFRLIGK